MTRAILALLASYLLTSSVQAADVTINNLPESLSALRNKETSRPSCASIVVNSENQNTASLFYGSGVCFAEDKRFDGSFLLLAGQVRALVDMNQFQPKDESDKETVSKLWFLIFYHLGGTGDDTIYMDQKSRNLLLDKLGQWSPTISKGYDPGWKYTSFPQQSEYRKAVSGGINHRHAQLVQYAKLISDPRYYAARKELDAIQRRNPKGIPTDNSPDGKRAAEINKELSRLQKEINDAK